MRLHQIAFYVIILAVTRLSVAQESAEIYRSGTSAKAGFVDLTLQIESQSCTSWVACSLHASGSFRGSLVGVEVIIQASGRKSRITYRSVGAKSDALLSALATLYKVPVNNSFFAVAASADIIFLEANAQRMAGKVFFAANGPSAAYAEIYTNINLTLGVLEIFEKDSEYRANVVKGLSQ